MIIRFQEEMMFISNKEKRILEIIYNYKNDKLALAKLLSKKSDNVNYKRIDPQKIVLSLQYERFSITELKIFCMDLKFIFKNPNKYKFRKYKKIVHKNDFRDNMLNISLNRLYASEYLKRKGDQIMITDKGTLAATDKRWSQTIIRENKSWLLSLVILIFALTISVITLLLKIFEP
jgi:hypothetical protein